MLFRSADHELNLPFTLPVLEPRGHWLVVVDTYLPEWHGRKRWKGGKPYLLRACSTVIFRYVPPSKPEPVPLRMADGRDTARKPTGNAEGPKSTPGSSAG